MIVELLSSFPQRAAPCVWSGGLLRCLSSHNPQMDLCLFPGLNWKSLLVECENHYSIYQSIKNKLEEWVTNQNPSNQWKSSHKSKQQTHRFLTESLIFRLIQLLYLFSFTVMLMSQLCPFILQAYIQFVSTGKTIAILFVLWFRGYILQAAVAFYLANSVFQ